MEAIRGVVSSAEAESKRLDKVFAGLGADGNLAKEFELLGSRGQEAFGEMSTRAQQLAKDIQEDTLSLSRLEKMQMALNEQYESGSLPLNDYINAQARLSVLHENISSAIRTNEQALRSETAAMDMAGDSIASLQAQLSLLTTSYMKLSQAQREGAEGQQILRNLSEVQSKLQNATSAMDQYAGAAGRQFNGLNFSIQQIARELPSLAMGPQMFFMAISNNLPMLTDELARARKEYAALQAQGQKGMPVWKQVVSSLFSWQTALAGGITLLVMYGDKIMSWISAVLKGRDAAVSATKALKDMQKAADFDGAGQQLANFERLRNIYVQIGDSASEKKKFIEQYKEEIEKTGISISNINEADNLFITNADAFVKSIRQRAMAMAGMELASEQFSKALKQQEKAESNPRRLERLTNYRDLYRAEYEKNLALYGENAPETLNSKSWMDDFQKKLDDFTGETFMKAGEAMIENVNKLYKQAEDALDASGLTESAKKQLEKEAADRINAIKQQQAQISALMDKNAKERIQRQVELENQVEQARIDAMADGYDKELAQRNLDNKMSLEAVERQKQEYIDAVIQGQKEIFEAQEKLRSEQNDAYVMKVFDPSSVRVDTSIFDRLEAQIRQGQLRSIQTSLGEALREVETYEQARLRIQQEYAEKRKALTDEDGSLKDGVTQGNMEELARQEQEAIDTISVTFAMRDAAFEKWSKSLASKTAEALDLMLSEAMEQLSILENTEGADPESIAKATAAVSKLSAALRESESGTGKSKVQWTDLNRVLSDSSDIFSELGEKIPGVAGDILSGIGNIATSAVSMASAIRGIGEAASAAEKASAILAVISAAVKALSFVTDTINENREANEAAAQAAWEYAEALDAVQESARLDKYDTIFGENAYGRLMEVVDLIKENRAEIQGILGSMTGASADDYYSLWSKGTNAFADSIAAMGNTSLVSDKRSKWQKLWGTGDKNMSAINLADYINDDGTVDLKRLNAWYEAWGDGLDESSKRLIDSILQNGEQLNQYLEEEKQYISSLMGDLSGTIADSMIDAFQKTGDAAIDAGDIISDVAKNFAKSWIESKLIEDIFNEGAQDKMFDLMESGDTQGALDYLSELIGEANSLAPQITEYLQGLDGLATEIEGTEQEQEQERTSASKGVAQASQDSVDELNGRATAIQGHTFSISTDMKTLVSTSAMMLDRLTAIESNTARLEAIESHMARMDSNIGDMVLKGVRMR